VLSFYGFGIALLVAGAGLAGPPLDHGGPSKRNAPLASESPCSVDSFRAAHATFPLQDAFDAHSATQFNDGLRLFASKKPVKTSSKYPFLRVKEVSSNQVVNSFNQGGSYSTSYNLLEGWTYAAPDDNVFRLTIAEALGCAQKDQKAFADAVDGWLGQEDLFKEYVDRKGNRKPKPEPDPEQVAKLGAMRELFEELKMQKTDPNPLVREFLAGIYDQMKLFNASILAEKDPSFSKIFLEQIRFIHSLKSKTAPTEQDLALLAFLGKFVQEPKFSYLLHPSVAEFFKSATNNGVTENPAAQMKSYKVDEIEKSLRDPGMLGPSFYLSGVKNLESSAAQILVKKGEAGIHIPNSNERMEKSIEEFNKRNQDLSPKEQLHARQKLQNRFIELLNRHDLPKSGASPQLVAARQALLHGVGLLGPSAKPIAEVKRIFDLSEKKPEVVANDLGLLFSFGRKTGATFDPAVLGQLEGYDPVLKSVLRSIDNGFTSYSKDQSRLLQGFLQKGDTAEFVKMLMGDSKFYEAATGALAKAGADPKLAALMKQASEAEQWSEQELQEYRGQRNRVREELLAEAEDSSTLSSKQKASLFALSLLDEMGLKSVTPRDDATLSSPDHYHLQSLFQALKYESEMVEAVSEITKKTPSRLEDEVFQHVLGLSGKRTGIPPAARTAILQRLNNISPPDSKDFVGKKDQLAFLDFVKGTVSAPNAPKASKALAESTLEKMLYLPLTPSAMSEFTQAHTGHAAFSLKSETPEWLSDPEFADPLYKSGFYDPKKFPELGSAYRESEKEARTLRRALVTGLLDFARSKWTERQTVVNGSGKEPSEAEAEELAGMEALANGFLESDFKSVDGGHFSSVLASALLGNDNGIESLLEEKVGTEALPIVLAGLEALKNSGAKDFLEENLAATVQGLERNKEAWDKRFAEILPEANESDKTFGERVLDEFDRYQSAYADLEEAAARNPQSKIPLQWKRESQSYFRSSDKIPAFLAGYNADPEAKKKVRAALTQAASQAEQAAKVEGVERQAQKAKVLRELTDPNGTFKDNRIGYDPALNTVVIAKDTFLDEKALAKLAELGSYNLFLEQEALTIPYRGHEALEDMFKQKRYASGHYGASTKANGDFFAKGEYVHPVNDETAVKVFQDENGKYTYRFFKAKEIQAELEKSKKDLVEKRAKYELAKKDFGGVIHAGKTYFGGVLQNAVWMNSNLNPALLAARLATGRKTPVLFDANQTSETKQLAKTYGEMMKALEWVTQSGHVEDAGGMPALERVQKNRELITTKLLPNELQELDNFVNKTEVIHDLTALLVSLPVSAGLQGALTKTALSLERGTAASRFGARALLTTAKAAKAYREGTKTAAKTAAIFGGIGQATKLGAMGLESLAGEGYLPEEIFGWEHGLGHGPKMIKEKMLKAKNGPWRTYGKEPKMSQFLKDENDTAGLKAYHKAKFEYELEEAMDPDRNGVPNDHPILDRKINGTASPMELAWSPVEDFAGSWKFFQGINLSKAAFPRGGLMGEMAVGGLWAKFFPFDPTLDRVRRGEKLRVKMEEESTGKPAKERTVWEIAGREVVGGAAEGLRFGVAGLPVQALMKRLPNQKRYAVLGTLAFIGADETTKYLKKSIENGKLESPFANPHFAEELGHSVTTGGYIGWGMAKGAQQHSREAQMKRKYLGISEQKSDEKVPGSALSAKPLTELIEKEFRNNEAEALTFLRKISPQEIARAPKSVQREFFLAMKTQGEKAIEEVQTFVRETNREDLKVAAAKLTSTMRELSDLSRQASKGTLTASDALRQESVRLEQEVLLTQLNQSIEPMKRQADLAQKKIHKLATSMKPLSQNELAQKQAAETVIKNYQENGLRINQAVIRMNTIDNFTRPMVAITSVLEPTSPVAKNFLREHPKARQAIQIEMDRRQKDPTAWELTKNAYQFFSDRHIAPNLSGLNSAQSYWENPHGFDGQKEFASKVIQSARKASAGEEEKAELLDVLRLVDPLEAVKIEAKEAK
jgi:hypothetical protein